MNTSKSHRFPIVALLGIMFLAALSGIILWRLALRSPPRDLAQVNCQAGDLGTRHVPFDVDIERSAPDLGETAVGYHFSALADLSLTYTVVYCELVVYEDEPAARRAFARLCASPPAIAPEHPLPEVGEQACFYRGSAPRNLAFRRDEILVLMTGDVWEFPGAIIDARLK